MINPYDKINKDKDCLKNCCHIVVGPKGEKGDKGEADTISIGQVITGEAGSSARIIDNKVGNNHILDFILPQGEQGKAGPELLKVSYLVTFNDGTNPNGIEVASGDSIPIERKELDTNNLIELDTTNNLIKFNIGGYYKITFNVSAYPEVHTIDFDPTKDIVSIGFKEQNTDNVYVGVSSFVYNGEPVVITTSGIISVTNTDALYELCNIGKYTINLESPLLSNLSSQSYFANPLVTLVIEYLGNK